MKYYIDKKLLPKRPWEILDLHPDDCEWVDEDDLFSDAEKRAVWDSIYKVIVAYGKLYEKDMIQKSR